MIYKLWKKNLDPQAGDENSGLNYLGGKLRTSFHMKCSSKWVSLTLNSLHFTGIEMPADPFGSGLKVEISQYFFLGSSQYIFSQCIFYLFN